MILPKEPNVLLMVALCGANLSLLSSIPQWRQQFDVVAAYVFDAWSPEIYPKLTGQLDRLFVPMPEIIDLLRRQLKVPVSLLPFGADALGQGSGRCDRPIDLMSYGRIPKADHTAFLSAFNHPNSDRLYYRSTPRQGEFFPRDLYAQRRDSEDTALLYHLLRKSKLTLAYDTLQPGMRQFPHSFVTLRWFQGGAAGCAIVGKRPTTPLADELLDWEEATIELPDDPQHSVDCIQDLLQDTRRLEAIHQRNYLQNLRRHDWRLRIRDLLMELQVPLPEPLVEQIAALKTKHRQPSQVSEKVLSEDQR
ncbi:MAG TPA: glycosyltransferase [Thermosynechococcaceae cyanobacterium]